MIYIPVRQRREIARMHRLGLPTTPEMLREVSADV